MSHGLQVGDKVELLKTSAYYGHKHATYKKGERGTVIHIFAEGSYGYGEVIVELDEERRPRVSFGAIQKLSTLDLLAEL